ncbi:stage III sporulation protein AB [Salsuginibacillus halophilus]|uniref:Stage III sporulation protein AB n=1 Tax=Salsuginibacillus halophilus TaxID=517424 RepID=A0A2P8HAD9_9BACI|nr:stage III sporulation protein SpoIIIAB [Salsuginibacillus halophilus]PSL43187.1 stage III sporulation protein AB [Salsuginibacillus halophilus]
MMLVGALIVLAAATFIGFEASRSLRERPRELRQLQTALQALEAEIMFGTTPLQEASDKLAGQLNSPVSLLFSEFSRRLEEQGETTAEAWQRSADGVQAAGALTREDTSILVEFGQTLGRFGRSEQQKQIRLALTRLSQAEASAREMCSRYERMAKSLGFLGGLLVIIALV